MFRFVKNKLYYQIFISLLATRFLIYVIGIVLFALINHQSIFPIDSLVHDTWVKWDTHHYLSIATSGYQNVGDEKYELVFFPLYPLIIFIVNKFLLLSPLSSGLIISWLAFAGAGVVLYIIINHDHGSTTALRTVKYLAIYPFSFFFGMVYTESLFLLFAVISFFFLQKKQWVFAAIFIGLATLTRLQGIILLLPAIIELANDFRHKKNKLNRNQLTSLLLNGFVMTSTVLISFGMYLLINKVVSGNWFQFLVYQKEHWHSSYTIIYKALSSQISYLIHEQNLIFQLGIWMPQTLTFFFSIGLIIVGYFQKIRLSYLAYWLTHLIISFSTSWLLSGTRFLLPMFTVYLVLAMIANRKIIDWGITLALILTFIGSMILFLQNVVL